MGSLRLRTRLEARGPAAAAVLTSEQVEELGEGAKRFPVRATANGHTWQTTVTRMRGEFLLGLSREVREAVGAEAGDEVEIEVELDTGPRMVELPPALAEALDGDARARTAFEDLAPSHRKEFARWVGEAKRDETRQRRIAQTLEMVIEGRTR